MINKTFAVIAAFAATLAAALALTATVPADEPPHSGEARYSFHKAADGYVRLDTQTGAVALCSRQPVGWACVTAPEDRAVLENEIARLHEENAALKQTLLSHGLPLPRGATAEPPAGNDGDGNSVTLRLPSNADVDRVIAFIGRVWHDFMAAIANAQNQTPHKS